MELSTILVGGAILLAMLVPVIYMIMNASGSDGKAKKLLAKLASAKSINLENIEVHGDIVFGIDTNARKLAYSYKHNVQSNFKSVDLKNIKSSRVKTTHIGNKTIETVLLELAGNGESYQLSFYDDNDEQNHSLDPKIALQNARDLDSRIRLLI